MEEQARLSGLAFGSDNPQWSTAEWPSLLGGWRRYHASVIIENDHGEQELVVIGGKVDNKISNSVLFMNLTKDKKEWIEGPRLEEGRQELAAANCNGGVYAIGGVNRRKLSTIERIDMDDLLKFNKNRSLRWKTLNCCLTTARFGCAAATVQDRYIVVVGGFDANICLSSVEIIETSQHTVAAGIEMIVRRHGTTIGVIRNHIYVVGGFDGVNSMRSVEYLEYNDHVSDDESNVASVFGQASSWKISSSLTLSDARRRHALVRVNTCLIVAGGYGQNDNLDSVEVLDTDRQVVWSLSNMAFARSGCSMTVLPDCVAVMGGYYIDAIELFHLLPSRKQQLMNSISCRAELDHVIHNYNYAIERMKDVNTTSIEIVEEAVEAENLLPVLESLRTEHKFLSSKELQNEIEKLNLEYNSATGAQSRLVILSMIEKRKVLLTKNEEFSAGCVTAVREENMNTAVHDEFYSKLVDVDYMHVLIKLHELVPLVSDVHKMRVFYTFVNILYRSNQLVDKERKHYTGAALENLAENPSNMSLGERKVWKIILQKCTEIGIQNIPVAEEGNYKSKESKEPVLQTDICHHLPACEFRVGKLMTVSLENTMDQNEQPITAHVKSLDWSLNQLYSAYCRWPNEEIAIAAICVLLNACRQFEKATNVKTAITLSRIVDFGDVAHIASAVQSTGSSSLQRAWDEGIQIVETLTGDNFLCDTSTNQGGPKTLASIMGNLAIALKKAVHLSNAGSNEEATILSLAVASKLTQAMGRCSYQKVPSEENLSEFSFCLENNDAEIEFKSAKPSRTIIPAKTMPCTGDNEFENIMEDPTLTKRHDDKSTSTNQHALSAAEMTMSLSSWDLRLHRLESTIGTSQRIRILEQMYGLPEPEDGQIMTIGERLSRLEHFFH